MRPLGFYIEHRHPPIRSGEVGGYSVKVRDNGLSGRCVGDEGLLWDALQEALARVRELEAQLDTPRSKKR